MAELFQNKYRIESARLKGWDYGRNGFYFVTICTNNRMHFFGKIVNNVMQLSKIGEIASREWINTTNARSNVIIDEWIVMPNHLLGIIIINNDSHIETHCNASLRGGNITPYKNSFGPQSNNLAAIIRGFKGAVTNQIHTAEYADFAWQLRFHDRIIRDEQELTRIRTYIRNNPAKWWRDRNNQQGLWM